LCFSRGEHFNGAGRAVTLFASRWAWVSDDEPRNPFANLVLAVARTVRETTCGSHLDPEEQRARPRHQVSLSARSA
jgi:hypothetical protein